MRTGFNLTMVLAGTALIWAAGCNTATGWEDGGETACDSVAETAVAGGAEFANALPRAKMATMAFDSGDRKMAFSARLDIELDDPDAAIKAVEAYVREQGGYVQDISGNELTVRIPSDKAEAALTRFESLGTITFRRISGDDITEAIDDTAIRLENLRKLHARLLALLDKSEKVEDTLKIEVELNRVTSQLESVERQLNRANARVNFVTFQLNFAETSNEYTESSLPIAWINQMGRVIAPQSADGSSDLPFDFDLPERFVILSGNGRTAWAVTGQMETLRLSTAPNLVGAEENFYSGAIRQVLEKNRYTVDCAVCNHEDGTVMIAASRGEGEAKFSTLVWVKIGRGGLFTDGKLLIAEYRGTGAAFEEHLAEVKSALADAGVPWYQSL